MYKTTSNTNLPTSTAISPPVCNRARAKADKNKTRNTSLSIFYQIKQQLENIGIKFSPQGQAHVVLHQPLHPPQYITLTKNPLAPTNLNQYVCVGSVSKFITGLVLQTILQKHGYTNQTTLGDIFDDKFFETFFHLVDTQKAKQITIDMLGRHQSGIQPGSPKDNQQFDSEVNASITRSSEQLGLKFIFLSDPGDGILKYSNIAVNILGMVAEKLEGKPFRLIMNDIFEKNRLSELEFKNKNASADIAYGIWATPQGISRLLAFMQRCLSVPNLHNTGFCFDQMLQDSKYVSSMGVKRGWLVECPYPFVVGHGGNIGQHRSHFFLSLADSSSGFAMVSTGIQHPRYWDDIRTNVKQALGWQDYQQLKPQLRFDISKIDHTPANCVAIDLGDIIYKKAGVWYAGKNKIVAADLEFITASSGPFVKFNRHVYKVITNTRVLGVSPSLAKIAGYTFEYNDQEEQNEPVLLSFSILNQQLQASITIKNKITSLPPCIPIKENEFLCNIPGQNGYVYCVFNLQHNQLELQDSVTQLLYGKTSLVRPAIKSICYTSKIHTV